MKLYYIFFLEAADYIKIYIIEKKIQPTYFSDFLFLSNQNTSKFRAMKRSLAYHILNY